MALGATQAMAQTAVSDTDGNGTIKGISTPLPDDLDATKNPNGINGPTGIPARVIIFTTIRDVGSTDGSLGPDDVADIIGVGGEDDDEI